MQIDPRRSGVLTMTRFVVPRAGNVNVSRGQGSGLSTGQPRETVRLPARLDASDGLERRDVDNGDVPVRRAGDIGACAIGLDLDSRRAPSNGDARDLATSAGVEDGQVRSAQ